MTFHTPEWLTDTNSLCGIWHYYKRIYLKWTLKMYNCFLTNALTKGKSDRLKPVWLLHWGLWQFSCAVGHRVTGPGAAAVLIDRLTVSILRKYLPSVGSLWESHQLALRVIGRKTPRQTWKVFFCKDVSSKRGEDKRLKKLASVDSCPCLHCKLSKTEFC